MEDMTIVIIESPFAGNEFHSEKEHITYAQRCTKDCLLRGEAPFVSHLLYTQPGVLDDSIPKERKHGIEAGFAFRKVSKKTVVYMDYGVSRGMEDGMKHAREHNHDILYRYINKNPV